MHPGHAGAARLRRPQGHPARRRVRRRADPHPAGAAEGGRPDRGRHRRPRARPHQPPLAALALVPLRRARRGRRDARPRLPRGRREDPLAVPGRPPDRAVQRDDAAGDPRARRPPPLRPGHGAGEGRDADHRHRRAVLRRGRRAREERHARPRARVRAARPGDRLRRTKIRCDQLYRTLRDRGMNVKALHGDMSQGVARRRDAGVQERPPADPRRHGRRRPRARHLERHARRELRRPDLARRLRPPHRPHRPGRPLGPGDHVRRAAPEARAGGDREERQHDDRAVVGGRQGRPGARHRAPAPAPQAARRRDQRRATRKLIASGGRAAGLAEADIIHAVAAGGGLDGEAIRNVRLLERFALLEVPAKDAVRVADAVDGTDVRGHTLRLEPARS